MSRIFGTAIAIAMLAGVIAPQTGGSYDLSHNVIAAGGGSQSIGGTFSVDGTSGQGLAGTVSTGGSYSLRGGFWAFGALAPTAAGVSVSGSTKTADGRGIGKVTVTLTNAVSGSVVVALSSPFGYYKFEHVESGQVYILSVESKQFTFQPSSRVISVVEELTGEDFTALP